MARKEHHMRHIHISTVLAISIGFALTVVATHSSQAQTFTVLHSFTGGQDGALPAVGLTMDAAGNLYGTTLEGGTRNYGVVFKLSHQKSGWSFMPLYGFQGGADGQNPWARLTFGSDGSL